VLEEGSSPWRNQWTASDSWTLPTKSSSCTEISGDCFFTFEKLGRDVILAFSVFARFSEPARFSESNANGRFLLSARFCDAEEDADGRVLVSARFFDAYANGRIAFFRINFCDSYANGRISFFAIDVCNSYANGRIDFFGIDL
jgi:hypothetical protein